jgi:hypothetical protein
MPLSLDQAQATALILNKSLLFTFIFLAMKGQSSTQL